MCCCRRFGVRTGHTVSHTCVDVLAASSGRHQEFKHLGVHLWGDEDGGGVSFKLKIPYLLTCLAANVSIWVGLYLYSICCKHTCLQALVLRQPSATGRDEWRRWRTQMGGIDVRYILLSWVKHICFWLDCDCTFLWWKETSLGLNTQATAQ